VWIESGLVRLLDDGAPGNAWSATRDALSQANIWYRLRMGLSDHAMMSFTSEEEGVIPAWTRAAGPAQYKAAAIVHALTIESDSLLELELSHLLSHARHVRSEAAIQMLESLTNQGRLPAHIERLQAASFAPSAQQALAALQRVLAKPRRHTTGEVRTSIEHLARLSAELATRSLLCRLRDPVSESSLRSGLSSEGNPEGTGG
jgi:hypothetical protein